jgi:hypothetical protein
MSVARDDVEDDISSKVSVHEHSLHPPDVESGEPASANEHMAEFECTALGTLNLNLDVGLHCFAYHNFLSRVFCLVSLTGQYTKCSYNA